MWSLQEIFVFSKINEFPLRVPWLCCGTSSRPTFCRNWCIAMNKPSCSREECWAHVSFCGELDSSQYWCWDSRWCPSPTSRCQLFQRYIFCVLYSITCLGAKLNVSAHCPSFWLVLICWLQNRNFLCNWDEGHTITGQSTGESIYFDTWRLYRKCSQILPQFEGGTSKVSNADKNMLQLSGIP